MDCISDHRGALVCRTLALGVLSFKTQSFPNPNFYVTISVTGSVINKRKY